MIISHKHKFIFLKTNKTAGTSIEIALSKHCGCEDIITPIKPEDEKTRRALGGRGPQHYLSPISDYGLGDYARLVVRMTRKKRYYNHITAREVKAHIGDQVWNEYYKFCFERNPFDRIISYYYWRYKAEPRPTLSEFIQSEKPLVLKRRGHGIYTLDGELAVDHVCRFENLAEELETVRTRLGIPEPLVLPHAKSTNRKDKRSYREILSEADRQRLADLFRDEISFMGYAF